MLYQFLTSFCSQIILFIFSFKYFHLYDPVPLQISFPMSFLLFCSVNYPFSKLLLSPSVEKAVWLNGAYHCLPTLSQTKHISQVPRRVPSVCISPCSQIKPSSLWCPCDCSYKLAHLFARYPWDSWLILHGFFHWPLICEIVTFRSSQLTHPPNQALLSKYTFSEKPLLIILQGF